MSVGEYRQGRWITVAIAALAIAVIAQGIILYQMYLTLNAQPGHTEGTEVYTEAQRSIDQDDEAVNDDEVTRHLDRQRSDDLFSWFDPQEWDPYEDMMRMRKRMDRMLGESWDMFRMRPDFDDRIRDFPFEPGMDLYEEGNNYIVRMNIPGADKGEFNVEIDGRVLTVSGSIDRDTEREDRGQTLRMERRHGSFSRSVTLPGPVNPAGMTAEYDQGVLTVTIPKGDADPPPQRIDVI